MNRLTERRPASFLARGVALSLLFAASVASLADAQAEEKVAHKVTRVKKTEFTMSVALVGDAALTPTGGLPDDLAEGFLPLHQESECSETAFWPNMKFSQTACATRPQPSTVKAGGAPVAVGSVEWKDLPEADWNERLTLFAGATVDSLSKSMKNRLGRLALATSCPLSGDPGATVPLLCAMPEFKQAQRVYVLTGGDCVSKRLAEYRCGATGQAADRAPVVASDWGALRAQMASDLCRAPGPVRRVFVVYEGESSSACRPPEPAVAVVTPPPDLQPPPPGPQPVAGPTGTACNHIVHCESGPACGDFAAAPSAVPPQVTAKVIFDGGAGARIPFDAPQPTSLAAPYQVSLGNRGGRSHVSIFRLDESGMVQARLFPNPKFSKVANPLDDGFGAVLPQLPGPGYSFEPGEGRDGGRLVLVAAPWESNDLDDAFRGVRGATDANEKSRAAECLRERLEARRGQESKGILYQEIPLIAAPVSTVDEAVPSARASAPVQVTPDGVDPSLR